MLLRRLRRPAVGLLGALCLVAIAVEYKQSQVFLDLDASADAGEAARTLASWRAAADDVPELADDAVVDVWYLEHLLSSWVLQGSPWNAFHSGIGFAVRNPAAAAGGKVEVSQSFAMDFSPLFTETIASVLHPIIRPSYPAWLPLPAGLLYARLAASYELRWQNQGGVRYYAGIPDKFTNVTMVGTTDGATVNKLVQWIKDYGDAHDTFEPVEILVRGSEDPGVGSCMCHDLFYHALAALGELGFQPRPAAPIFRDHIMLFAETYEKVDLGDAATRRDVVRYYRLFSHFMQLINVEFTNIRGLLVKTMHVSMRPFVLLGGEYYRVALAPPFVNYCYLQVEMPPGRASLWTSEHLCALDQEATAAQENASFATTADWLHALADPTSVLYLVEAVVDDMRLWTALLALALATLVV